jgi:glycosyltransferase involved in cell wall biosynthesis
MKTQEQYHQNFLESERPHILMITNHGIHEWEIVAGLPDTGGQNAFVNQFSDSLEEACYRVTIVNRGGFPHPTKDTPRKGFQYKSEHLRILYIQDSVHEFVRKEDMQERIPELCDNLVSKLKEEPVPEGIISHYWDGALLGIEYNKATGHKLRHFWIPHSLGTIKKANMKPETWESLRVDERINIEKEIAATVDCIGSTSNAIESALRSEYNVDSVCFLPPCINSRRFFPRQVQDEDPIWHILSQNSGMEAEKIRSCKIITEISRTDRTKRKDVLIKAFKQIKDDYNAFLIVTISKTQDTLSRELMQLIQEMGLNGRVAVLGNVFELVPKLYAISDVYCTPSVMEGFGMSIQEAAATRVPSVSSDLVPFAVEYLCGNHFETIADESFDGELKHGKGAIIVPADNVNGFAYALNLLLSDDKMRTQMGQDAFDITIPYFTWENMTESAMQQAGFKKDKSK